MALSNLNIIINKIKIFNCKIQQAIVCTIEGNCEKGRRKTSAQFAKAKCHFPIKKLGRKLNKGRSISMVNYNVCCVNI